MNGDGGDDREGAQQAMPITEELIADQWSDPDRDALDGWKQGDLVAEVPVFWAGPGGPDRILSVLEHDEASGSAGATVVWDPSETLAWSVIVSQTCDVIGTGAGASHPFAQVSPLVPIDGFSDSKVRAIEDHEVSYLCPVTSPPEPGRWAVDLRLVLPISKSVLVNQEPKSAFATERDAHLLSEVIAAKFRRPALHDELSTRLVESINSWIKTRSKGSTEWWERVAQLRLEITSGTRLDPSGIRLIVIQDQPLDPASKDVWKQWQKDYQRSVRGRMALHVGIPQFTNLDAMKARLYRESIYLNVSRLRRPPSA